MVKEIDYEFIAGDKPTVVMLHGWGLNKSAFSKVVQKIKSNQSILTLDFYGFGKSQKPDDYYDTYEYAYHIFLLLKKLNINDVVLVGHSFGGRVAIILSSIFKINVCKLILTSSAGLNKFSIKKTIKIWFYKIKKYLVKINVLNNKILYNSGSCDYQKLDNNMRAVFVKIVNQDLKFLLHKITVNTYLVWDKKDMDTPYWICKRFHRYILNSFILIYQNGGHFTYIKNINKFANLLNSIL